MSVETLHDEIDRQIKGQLTYDMYRDGADRAAHKLAYRVLTVLGREADPGAVDGLRLEIHSRIEAVAAEEGWDEDEDTDDSHELPPEDKVELILIKGEK